MKSAFVAIGVACLLSACSANPVERAEVGFGMGAAMGAAAGTSMGVATAPVPPPSPPMVSPYSYP